MILSKMKNMMSERRHPRPLLASRIPFGGYLFNAYRTPPSQLYLRVTEECNYRCKPCHIWTHKNPVDALTTQEKLDLVRQFHTLNNKGIIWLTGGEPLKKMDEFLEITSLCRNLGLYVGSNTNGSYIGNETTAEKIVKYGPNLLLVSFDSNIKEIHNYIRGIEGSYDQVLQAVNLLLKIRNAHFAKYKICIGLMCLLFEETLPLFKDYIEFCRKLGVDFVGFQVLNPTFANKNKETDIFYAKHYFKDNHRAIGLLDDIYAEYKNDKFVSLADIDVVREIIITPSVESKYPICKSHERNIIVMINGDVQLCFNSHQIFRDPYLGNVRSNSLRELWISDKAKEARIVMDNCRRNCGLLNCHRKISKMEALKLLMFMKYGAIRKWL